MDLIHEERVVARILRVDCNVFCMAATAPQPPKAPGLPPTAPATPPSPPAREEKIVVIPESFYGVALTMQPPFPTDDELVQVPKPVAPTPPPAPTVVAAPMPLPTPPEHHSRLGLVALLLVVVLAIGGGWVAWNREAFFGTPSAPPVVVAPPATPNAPENLEVTSTTPGAVRITWSDRSESEAGFRVERKTAFDTVFTVLQTLPANSLTFLDTTAPAGARVGYRVVAFNASGEMSSVEQEVDVQAMPEVPAQPTLPPDGLDSDSDGLTDTEEGVYGTVGNLPDSDGDGYLDGNEVFNLYDPSIAAPATLLSSLGMRTVSSTVGWQMLAPRTWMEEQDPSGEVRLRVPTGEVLRVFVEAAPLQGTLSSWLTQQKGWPAAQLVEMSSNKYRLPFVLSPDRLQAFFVWNDRVLTVKYELGTQTFVNYRLTFGMMINGLRFEGAPLVPDLASPVAIPEDFQPSSSGGSASVEQAPMSDSASSTLPSPEVPTGTVSSLQP